MTSLSAANQPASEPAQIRRREPLEAHAQRRGVFAEHTSYREGWPANAQNPTTSRDVFEWNGTTYVFKSCEVVEQRRSDRQVPAVRVIPAGSGTCRGPIGKYSVDLDGDRDPSTQPP